MNAKETENDQTYLLTGATGFLGGHIMAGLLLKGKNVAVAGRPSRAESLKARIEKRLAWFGIGRLAGGLEFYETDLLKTRLGLDDRDYGNLCRRDLKVVHCASDTSFAERDRKKVMTSNVEGIEQILNLAVHSRARRFYYLSTAFAAGTGRTECLEAPADSVNFTNVYEESKARAEAVVTRICRENGLPYTIIRPSIVYGDSRTGRSLRFNALYYPVRALKHIRDIYLSDIRNNRGIKAAESGIYINDDGSLHLPVRIFIEHDGHINLVPVDYFTETMLAILEKPAAEAFYHITSRHPESLAKLSLFTERFLNIRGIDIVIGQSGAHTPKNPPEELFGHFMKPYRPYLSDKRIFTRRNTDRDIRPDDPPELDYDIFHRCMAFADAAGWGKTLFS